MSNVKYRLSDGGTVAYGELPDGTVFSVDADMLPKISKMNFYKTYNKPGRKQNYIVDCHGRYLHDYILEHNDGLEVDHISMDTMDNRKCNIRYCTHQQNQANQGLQSNNTSGVVGVSYYPPRHKFKAMIKVSGHDLHLGYYDTFDDAVKARNVAMRCMFGSYGRYDDVGDIPKEIENDVIHRCLCSADLAVSSVFFEFREAEDGETE